MFLRLFTLSDRARDDFVGVPNPGPFAFTTLEVDACTLPLSNRLIRPATFVRRLFAGLASSSRSPESDFEDAVRLSAEVGSLLAVAGASGLRGTLTVVTLIDDAGSIDGTDGKVLADGSDAFEGWVASARNLEAWPAIDPILLNSSLWTSL